MATERNVKHLFPDRDGDTSSETGISLVTEGQHASPNERPIDLAIADLQPHVRIVRPARPSLIYERVE